MVLFVLFRDSVQTEYKTSVCSKATLLIFFINFLMLTIPFLVAYNTQGFWLKSNTYEEQPDVHFIYEYFVLIETDDVEMPIICSTFESISSATEDFNNCPIIKVREEDFNKDGKYDKLYFVLEALVGENQVHGVTAVLLFDYKLNSHSWFEMQTMGWVELNSALGGGRLEVTGDLRLHQRALLGHKGQDLRFNTSIVTAKYPHEFTLFKLLSGYTERNVTTRINNVYNVWTRGRDPERPFVFTLELTYPVETVRVRKRICRALDDGNIFVKARHLPKWNRYRPGTWQVVKVAWLQYLALFYLSVLVGRKLKHFVLDNRLVNNIRYHPWRKSI